MMKRAMSILGAGLLILLAAFTAAGESQEPAENSLAVVEWKEFRKNSESIVEKGSFVSLTEIGMKLWVPDECARQDYGDPTVCAFYSDSAEDAFGFSVFTEELPEDVPAGDRDALFNYISTGVADPDSASRLLLNGVFCVGYTIGLNTQTGISFPAEDGQIVSFVIETMTEEESDHNAMIRLMAASIMPAAMDPDAAE